MIAVNRMASRRFFFWLPFAASTKKEYAERRVVGYTSEQMFDVVANVDQYPQFVPWCRGATVQVRAPNVFTADMKIGFPPLQESYVSTVTALKPVLVKSVAGPNSRMFKHLDTTWRFSEGLPNNEKSCTLHFHLAFEFHSALHSSLAHAFFDRVVESMVIAFLKRAEAKYGPPSLDHYKTGCVLKKVC